MQVTSEIGQECLKLQESMRGGLLGFGHSWVAGASDREDPSLRKDMHNHTDGKMDEPQHQQPSGRLMWRQAWQRIGSIKEDTLDFLAIDALQLRASRGSLACGVGVLMMTALVAHLFWQVP